MLNQKQKRLCYLALSKWADSLYLEYQDINKDIIKADLGLKTIVDKNTLVKMADNRKALMADLDNEITLFQGYRDNTFYLCPFRNHSRIHPYNIY